MEAESECTHPTNKQRVDTFTKGLPGNPGYSKIKTITCTECGKVRTV